MKFYRIKNNSKLHSFGDEMGDCPILGKTLSHHQNEYITQHNGTVITVSNINEINETESYFSFDEDLFFSDSFLKSALSIALAKKCSLQFCLAKNTFNERWSLPSSADRKELYEYGFYYHHAKGNSFEKVVLPQKIYEHIQHMPDQIIRGGEYHADQCETFATHLISPFHLMMANLAMNLARTVKFQEKIPAFLRNRFGKAKGKWFYRGLKRINQIGKNCLIHPTALIEGSIIGDNTIIGANSIVRLSHLEANCYVSDNVSVINSVLGEKTFIANSNYINSCLTYPEAFLIHGPYQISVIGKSAACFAVINCDIRLDQKNIKISTSQGILDSGQPFLGVAYGHRSKTGGGNIIAAGRIVPNDLHVNPPDNIILSFDKS